jgi:hypothetical protein
MAETKAKSKKYIKNAGANIKPEDEAKAIKFMSLRKETMIFNDAEKALNSIKFNQHIYRTANKGEIEFLRSLPLFNVEIFEGSFPKHVVDKFEEDKKWLTKHEDMYEAPR